MKIKLQSFDVFDTVLTRIYARPTDLFYDLAQELREQGLHSLTDDAWVKLRILEELEARGAGRHC